MISFKTLDLPTNGALVTLVYIHSYFITLRLKGLYNGIMTIFQLSRPQSLISFIQLLNHLIFHVLVFSTDGSVFFSKIWIVSLIIVSLVPMKFWRCMEYLLWFRCIRVLFPHVGSTHLPFRVSNNIANNFLFNIIPPAITPPPHVQCVSNCFTP